MLHPALPLAVGQDRHPRISDLAQTRTQDRPVLSFSLPHIAMSCGVDLSLWFPSPDLKLGTRAILRLDHNRLSQAFLTIRSPRFHSTAFHAYFTRVRDPEKYPTPICHRHSNKKVSSQFCSKVGRLSFGQSENDWNPIIVVYHSRLSWSFIRYLFLLLIVHFGRGW